MYDSWNVTKDGEKDVNEEIGTTSALHGQLENQKTKGILQGRHLFRH